MTCSIKGEFCVNDTCKCGVFGGPSCEVKTSGDFCMADFSTCSCSANSLGEFPSGYSYDTKYDTCVRSNNWFYKWQLELETLITLFLIS